jgi:subtilisin family serine protease
MARGRSTRSAGSTRGGSGQYYYAGGERHPVQRRDDLVAVVFHSRAQPENFRSFADTRSSTLEPVDEFAEMQESNVRIFKLSNGRSAAARRSMFADIREEGDVEHVGPVYTNEHGQPLVLTEEIVCKFKPEKTSDEIQRLLAEHGLEEVDQLGFSENAFVLRVTPDAKKAPLEIANDLVEKGHAEYAYPNWIEHIGVRATIVEEEVRHGLHATDPLFGNQWHHENTGQVVAGMAGTAGADVRSTLAWTTTMGNPAIRLAVIDNGTDIAHADLNVPGKLVDPIDLTVTPPDANPTNPGDPHGTQVAGMAVATANNGVVGCGSAPNCRLIAIRTGDTIAQVRMARGFEYAADHGADVITCSLGPVGAWTMTDALREAIDYATTYGRNGRGCVYFQAVDNATNPISVDQVSSYERSVAVSRTNNRDRYDGAATTLPSTPNQFTGPAMGPELDLAAPGRDVTMIANTAPPNMATMSVSTGTSFATPLTAGVACLVLSVNPSLSWEEVRQVMLDSADKIDAAAFPYPAAPANRPPGTRNDRYGYGRVNAQGAVQQAAAGSTRDLHIRDTLADTGTVPQPAWGFWDSPDIWVRNADDGVTVHQDTIRGSDNFLHARIWNRGSQASLPCWVRFYITSFAGTEFRYPFDYKQNTSGTHVAGHAHPGNLRPASQFPNLGTYRIGVHRIQSIPAGGSAIAKLTWPAALIPPALNWHPCLLVEVSPHDGPLPTGPHTWENNNLGQKNITIVDARRGTRIEFPFRFGHPQLREKIAILDVRRSKVPRTFDTYLDLKDPALVEAVAKLHGVPLDRPPVEPEPEPFAPLSPILPDIVTPVPPDVGPRSEPGTPWRVTFLEEARIAVSAGQGRAEGEALVFDFPRGSAVEIGRGRMEEIMADEGLDGLDEWVDEDGEGNGRAVDRRPSFEVTQLDGVNVLALLPRPKGATIRIPVGKAGRRSSSLIVDVPKSAVPGEQYVFDVAGRTAAGRLVGGTRLQINVVD